MNLSAPLFERVRAAVTTAIVCFAVLSPMIPDGQGKRHDDYPLSWYPMFRGVRPKTEQMNWVRATLEDGTTRPISYRNWTPGGLSEGRAHLDRAVRERDTAEFCERLAKKFGKKTSGWASETTTIEIVRSTFVLETWFGEGETKPEQERIVHTCLVAR